jgi:hypothetical protein
LRTPVERISAFAGLGFDELGDDGQSLCFGESLDSFSLGFNPQARALLLPCGDTIIGNSALHTIVRLASRQCEPHRNYTVVVTDNGFDIYGEGERGWNRGGSAVAQ